MTILHGTPCYRITSPDFKTITAADHVKVVNGEGSSKSSEGSRYSPPGATTVFLGAQIETCFAEKLFYFQRETLEALDNLHVFPKKIVPYRRKGVLWEITFTKDFDRIADLQDETNQHAVGIFPTMVASPFKDYKHLGDKRITIAAAGYSGLRVPSARCKTPNSVVFVLFGDQSAHVHTVNPYDVEFHLVDNVGTLFTNHATQILDFGAGSVRFLSTPPAGTPWTMGAWHRVDFNH